MHPVRLLLLLITLELVAGWPLLRGAEESPGAYLAFACDGTAREQRFLQEQSGTWIINQTRAFAATAGRAVYRVPVGHAQLERLQLGMNLVPYRLEFSADGDHWEGLTSTAGVESRPTQFSTQGVGFAPAQREAATASGHAWFRLSPAGESPSETLQLRYLRLDVRGPEVPPQFTRPNWWRNLAPGAAGWLMVLVGALPVLIVWRRWRVTWRVWGAGGALWMASVALKFAVAWVTNAPVNRWLHAQLPQAWAGPAFWTYVGLLTGVFECGIFLLVASLIRRKQWSWHDALSLGVGFGAIEALAVGAFTMASANQAGPWGCLTTWSDALAPAFERLLALVIHVAAAVMILRAFIERRGRWFGASFAYKSAVDGVAAWLLLSGTSLRSYPWMMEWVCFAPFALIGVVVLGWLGRRWPEPGNRSWDSSAKQVSDLVEE